MFGKVLTSKCGIGILTLKLFLTEAFLGLIFFDNSGILKTIFSSYIISSGYYFDI